jgi:hypothetical protein
MMAGWLAVSWVEQGGNLSHHERGDATLHYARGFGHVPFSP